MCAKKIPFDGRSLQDLYRKIKRGIFPRIPRSYSDKLYRIINLMLTTNPKKRPRTAELLSNPIIRDKLVKFKLNNF